MTERSPEEVERLLHDLPSDLESRNQELREPRVEMVARLSRFAEFYDHAPVGYLTIDAAGVIQETNLTAANLLGVERRVLFGQPFSRYLTAEDQDIFQRHIEQYFETGATQVCELLLLPNARPAFWARLESPLARAGDGWPALCRLVLSDITERKRVEETLKRSERQLNDLINFLPDATLAVDGEKKIIVWNKAIERMTGLKAEEMIGKGNFEYAIPFYGDRRPILLDRAWEQEHELAENYSQVDREGESLSAEAFCPALYGGQGAHVFAKVTPLHDQNGRVIGAIESIRDISDLKRADDKLAKAYAELELRVEERTLQLAESNRDLQHFANMASHDLREPLLLIQAFCRRLSGKYGSVLDETGHEYLRRIEVLTERMARLLGRMLLYSKVATHPGSTALADLTRIAHEVIADLQMRIEKSGGRVELEELGDIEADQLQIHQLLQNLLANSLKYHRPGIPPVVKIFSRLDTDVAGLAVREITVEDNGIGFAESQGARLFEMFHRHHPEISQEGSGIGLAICKRIVERHDGTIVALGKPGEGAKFIIRLPVKQSANRRIFAAR